jgi:hypothetical protein
MRKMLKVTPIITGLIILISLFITGCSSDTGEPLTEEDGYSIKILSGSKQIASLSLSELQSLPKVSLTAYGKSEEGPTLPSVLELAGVEEYTKVTVIGMVRGRIASAELTLTRSEITDEVILDFSNRGTCKLAGATIPDDNWIIDVEEMRLE